MAEPAIKAGKYGWIVMTAFSILLVVATAIAFGMVAGAEALNA